MRLQNRKLAVKRLTDSSKTKLSWDPNNTKWTNDTSSFGHKIMSSQGWKAGEYLGAKDAPHAEYHTAANASHIRVVIKDNNLGLGAKIGSGVGAGECTGLDAFQNLLGRLNGRDEDELEKEQKSREDLKRAIYTEQKWGTMRFVKGGFLIGDKIQDLIDDEAERVRKLANGGETSDESSDSSSEAEETAPEPVIEKSKSKKRKLEDAIPEVVAKPKKQKINREPAAEEPVLSKKEAKEAKRKSKEQKIASEEVDVEETSSRKKSKKKSKKARGDEEEDPTDAERKQRKREKKERREKEENAEGDVPKLKKSKRDTPVVDPSAGASTPVVMQGRHAVRARNIAQKRMGMDAASLAQVRLSIIHGAC